MAVACYIKLADLPSALSVSRKMTKHAAKDARGYLRMSQVLQLQEKPEMALEIYKLALRRCTTEDPEKIRLLQAKRDELTGKLCKPKSQDPIVVLPAEIMDMVMDYLNFKQKVACLSVSKHWNEFLSHQPSLWSELDLSLARRPVPSSFVRSCIYRSKDKKSNGFLLRTAKFNRMKDSGMVTKLVRACRNLEALEFLGSELSGSSVKDPISLCSGLRTLRLGKAAVITLDNVTQILKGRPTLVTAEFENIEARRDATWDADLPNLQTLSFGAGCVQEIGVHVLSVHQLVDRIPNIRSLALTGWKYHMGLAVDANFSGLEHLEALHLTNTFFAWQPRLPKSIKHLTLTASWGWGSTLSMQRMLEIDLPVIVELNYINEGSERDNSRRFIHTLLQKTDDSAAGQDAQQLGNGESLYQLENRSVRKFSLERCPLGSSGKLVKILEGIPRLHGTEDLTLVQAEFQDEVVFAQAIVQNFRNLRRLSIPSCKITGVGVKMLIQELRECRPSEERSTQQQIRRGLEYLNLDWCTSISQDAVEWARAQGVEVSWRTTAPKPSGKKIRYA
ncbi:F-box domain cyclin-like protein [Macrophomina phaseolina MS6]|uniref:F-box domain cyclin-like protein n=1 Tax=Macrophomina phaseolina (strain MS6) TaxID=1126212 RepID=K2S6W9_MACPH|nr:F-box domain cyclin-like protein [Macrophomina phaseolina MS6]